MGPFDVEFFDEIVEAGLLLQEIGTGRFGCLQLQGRMHALMAAVLLRMAWFDTFNVDAKPEPPHR